LLERVESIEEHLDNGRVDFPVGSLSAGRPFARWFKPAISSPALCVPQLAAFASGSAFA
jgi:hypothetical protein